MTAAIVVKHVEVYGFFELKKNYTRNYTIGTALAVFLHLLVIGTYYFAETYNRESTDDKMHVMIIDKISEIPQTTIQPILPRVNISASVAVPKMGVPVPVPNDEASDNQTLSTQEEIRNQQLTLPGLEKGFSVQVNEKIEIEEKTEVLPNEKEFIPFEKMPEMVRAVTPEYPEIAKRAGITGKVFVKVLVDKEGRARKALVVKSDSELFNQNAIDAAMKSAFTPALQNQRPIAVWIVLPYKFTLEGQN